MSFVIAPLRKRIDFGNIHNESNRRVLQRSIIVLYFLLSCAWLQNHFIAINQLSSRHPREICAYPSLHLRRAALIPNMDKDEMMRHQENDQRSGPFCGRRPTIGLLNPRLDLGFQRAAWLSVASAAKARDLNLILLDGGVLHSPDETASPASIVYSLIHPDRIDGLIVWSSSLSWWMTPQQMVEICERYRPIPLVSVGQALPGIPSIIVDNYQGVRDLVVHLIETHGYRRIAFLHAPEGNREGALRFQGYTDALTIHGIPLDPCLASSYTNWDRKDGVAAIHLFIEERGLRPGIDFQAIVSVNDDMACGAVEALQARGIRVPDDVAVTGFNDDEEGRAMIPALTTVRQPIEMMGEQSVGHLRALLRQEPVPKQLALPLEIVVRRSCGCMSHSITKAAGRLTRDTCDAAPAKTATDLTASAAGWLVDLRQMMHVEATSFPSSLRERLVDSFVASLQLDEHAARLRMSELTSALYRYIMAGADAAEMQEAISILHGQVLPFLLSNSEMYSIAEDFWQQVRITIQEAAVQRQAYRRFLDYQRSQVLSEVNQEMQTAGNWTKLMDAVALGLPRLGVKSCYLALYEDPAKPTAWSRLMLAYNENGRITLGDGLCFPSPQLVPPQLLPSDRHLSLVTLPLYFRDRLLGFVVLEVDPAISSLCESLRQHLSTAVEVMRLRAETQDAWQQAEQANTLKSRFLASVSHELRTPLSLIVGTTEIMLREADAGAYDLPAAPRHDLDSIHTSAQHLGDLIGDVLDLAACQIGELRLMYAPLDLSDVLREVSKLGEPLARARGLAWRSQIPAYLPLVWGDRARLRQVTVNLIANAIKFTDQGVVTLRARSQGKTVTVEVSDTGVGIPAAEQEIIFDEFRQSERTAERGYGGVGLGLAISKRLVELHQGEIGVHSSGEEGGGSTFCFTLPVLAQPPSEPVNAGARRDTVLVLTTSAGGCEALRQHLTQKGFPVEVLTVAAGNEWITQIMSDPPGAVVLDFEPATERGWELMKILKENSATQAIPVVFYSLAEDGERGAVLELGYASKPLCAAELARTLKQHSGKPARHGKVKTILLVDDDPGALDLHERELRLHLTGWQIRKARNGREALQKMKETLPDLVLLDLMMPELDGFGVLEAMRSREATRDVPVIVLTAQILTNADMARLGRGVTAVLDKAIYSRSEVLAHVEAAVARVKRMRYNAQLLVRRTMAFIHDHYADELTREQLAKEVSVSERYLTRCFRLETGLTPIMYLTRYRIKRARALLEEGALSVTEVALATGFSDSHYFSKVFRVVVGISPSLYQRGERLHPD